MTGAKRLTREQIEDMQDRRHWTPLTPDQVNALCDMALESLRQQDGVVVPKQWIDWAEKVWIDTGHWDAASLHSAMIAAAEKEAK